MTMASTVEIAARLSCTLAAVISADNGTPSSIGQDVTFDAGFAPVPSDWGPCCVAAFGAP